MRKSLLHSRLLLLTVTILTMLLVVFGVTLAQSTDTTYIPLRMASGTFDPLQTTGSSLEIPASLNSTAEMPAQSIYYIVQFDGPITEQDKDNLVEAGAKILTYVPDYAFIVRVDATALTTVQSLENFRWVGEYEPYFRLSPELIESYIQTAVSEPLDLVILLPPDVDETAVIQAISDWGGAVTAQTATHWTITLRATLNSDQLAALAILPDVQWIEQDHPAQLFNSRAGEVTNVETVWDSYGLYGEGQVIAVADSGFDQGSSTVGSMHPDFEDGSGGSRVLHIYDTALDANLADDAVVSGHGTHVSGTVLGNGLSSNDGSTASDPTTNSFSNDTNAGAAPKASLVFQALINNSTHALLTPINLNDLFNPPYTGYGARIHTNSWGSSLAGAYTSRSRNVDEFTWDNPDMLILFAAGNDGVDSNTDGVVDMDSIGSPATAKNALTVGASENNRPTETTTYNAFSAFSGIVPFNTDPYADNIDGMAAFSSRGYTDDGRVKPDIVAPGTAIYSTCAVPTGCTQGDYISLSGTSMATPHVAGASALAREYFLTYQTLTPSGSLLKAALLNGAVDMAPGQYGTGINQEITLSRPSPQAGWGRLNLEQSLFRTSPYRTWFWDAGSTTTIEYPLTGLQSGDVVSYTFEVEQTGNISATLVWNDYPGSPLTNGGLVNDLDLQIEGPGGTRYYPNNASQSSPYYLSYDDGSYEAALSWPNTTGLLAVRFTPGFYPAVLAEAQIELYRSPGGDVTFGFDVYDDNGSGNTPGTSLCSNDNPVTLVTGFQRLSLDLSACNVTVNSGDVYLVFRQVTANDPSVGADTTSPSGYSYFSSNGTTWSQDNTRNYMITAGFTNPATSFDRVNNVVGIDIPNAATGTYTATLSGYNVPFGPQPYAFVLAAPGRLLGTETVTRTINGAGTYIFGNTGISMTFASEAIDAVSVTVYRDQFPTTVGTDSVINRRYDITSSGGSGTFTTDIAFSYEDAELNSLTEGNLQPFRWDGSNWQPITVANRDSGANVVEVSGVTAFSTWVLGTPTPTAVSLQPLSGNPQPTPAIVSLVLMLLFGGTAVFWFWRRRKLST